MPDAVTDPAAKAATLAAALPYLRRYAGTTIVVKYGGHAMGDDAIALRLAPALDAGRRRSLGFLLAR